QSCHSNIAKNRHPLRTCPQASAGIVARKGLCLSSMTSHSLHDTCCYRKVELDKNWRNSWNRLHRAERSMAAMSASNTTTQDLPCHITRVAGPATHAQREAWRWLWSRLLREERASRG